MPKLYHWQEDNARAILQKLRDTGYVIDTSSTGAGKTHLVCAVAAALKRPIFVVCPLSVVDHWHETAESWGVGGSVINYEMVFKSQFGRWIRKKQHWEWDLPSETILVFDEAHRLSGATSQTSKMLRHATHDTILLSATIGESPLKLRTIGAKAGLFNWTHEYWTAWCMANGCYLTDFNDVAFSYSPFFVEKIRQQLEPHLTGINTANVPDFPCNNIMLKSVPVKHLAKLNKAYQDELEALQAEAETDLVANLRARQMSENLKLPVILEMAKGLYHEGNNVVIMTAYQETARFLADKLKVEPVIGENKSCRKEQMRRFQANQQGYIVGTLACMSEGISLHDLHGRPRASIVCPTDNPVHFAQALGRIARAGALSPANQYVVFAKGCHQEQRVRRNISRKINAINTITKNELILAA